MQSTCKRGHTHLRGKECRECVKIRNLARSDRRPSDLIRPLAVRFWEKVNKNGPIPAHRSDLGPCWIWTASVGSHGYGQISNRETGKPITAPHAALEIAGIKVPKGFVPDHLCENKSCVNPSHLEIVTVVINVMRGNSVPARNARKTHCRRGHELVAPNLQLYRWRGRQIRKCQACTKINNKEQWERRHETRHSQS